MCLLELCISGYGCEDAFLAPGTLTQSRRVIRGFGKINQTNHFGSSVYHWLCQNRLYNTVCSLVDGKIGGFVAKRFLPSDGLHYEPRWFHRFTLEGVTTEGELGRQRYPIGDIFILIVAACELALEAA